MAIVYLNNGTRRNSIPGQLVRVDPNNPRNFIAVDINTIDVIGIVKETRGPGNPTRIDLINHPPDYNDIESLPRLDHFGDDVNYTEFDGTGHQTIYGEGRPWRDELGDAVAIQQSGPGVSRNTTNVTVDFTHASDLNDFLYCNVQMNHDKDLTASIYPHLHWHQSKNYSPNLLFAYRWQRDGYAYTSDWTYLKCNNLAFDYEIGTTLNQISYSAPITPPSNVNVSDIVQFKIYRDNADASLQFGGACPYNTGGNAIVPVLSFDVHFQINSLGSTEEYVK